MKRVLAILPLIVGVACASSSTPKPSIPEPSVDIRQLVGPKDLTYPEGPIEVQYAITVENRADIPITLSRVEVRTVNPAGGSYALRPDFYNFHQVIPPKSTQTVTFWAKAYSYGRGPRENEPVTIRGVVHFESASGTLQTMFIRELSQYGD